jgi:hypothetical protein
MPRDRPANAITLRTPLTLGAYAEACSLAGAHSTAGHPTPDAVDVRGLPQGVLLTLCDLLGVPGLRYTEGALPEVAAALWLLMLAEAAEHRKRADATVARIEDALGSYLPRGEHARPVSMERVLYALDPADVDALTAWPCWRAWEYLGVRAVEAEYRAEEEKLARSN